MLEIERILFPTDFSECARHAFPHTLHFADNFHAEVHLLHALVLHETDPANAAHPLPDVEGLYEVLEEHAESQLASAVASHGDGVKFRRAQVRSISAAGAILAYAADHAIDLITMGTHGRRGLRRLLLGSVAEEVVRLAPCPVLTVPERTKGPEPGHVARILVPVDFSEHAKLALVYANQLAQLYAARLHLLHVIDEVVYPDFYPPVVPPVGPASDELRERSEEGLRELIAQVTHPNAETHVGAGRASPEIVRFAEELSADLIVIASHGLTGIRHMLLGSVTEQVIRGAPCPVFTVKVFRKPPGRGSA